MYRGPATGLKNKLGHWLVCILTLSRYSHCELVIDGTCYSSSFRDGGVRSKLIDFTNGKWDVFPIAGDEEAAWRWFQEHKGQRYDWQGIVRFVLPFVRQRPDEFFCSEAVAAALGLPRASRITPQDLKDMLT